MQMREGDLLQTKNNIIFDVKGLVHPPNRVIAFPRFIPDISGSRVNRGIAYSKVYSISERFKFLKQKFPHYIVYDHVFDEKLCEVPLEDIKHHYEPAKRLHALRHSKKLDRLEEDALRFLELLREKANLSWSKMGISGSLLVKLHTAKSDIDPIVYGSKNCHKAHEALKTLTQDQKSHVKKYSKKELCELFKFRVKDTQMLFEEFVKTEPRKILQGKFKNRDYFMRFVKDWSESETEYGAVCFRNVGGAKIKAVIEDDSESIFTPCSYRVKKVDTLEGVSFPISEIASFRGRFCEQARIDETVVAQGKVEHVADLKQNREFFRLLLGNKPSDFMALA